MIFEDIAAFADHAPAPWLGLDLGTKTIGVATSDILLNTATPLKTLKRTKFTQDAAVLIGLMQGRSIGGLILGLPRNMDGSEGPRCQSTRAFAHNLIQQHAVPIGFWDERLSTVVAERVLLDADASRKRRAQVIDSVAATFILQGALDRLAHIRAGQHGGR